MKRTNYYFPDQMLTRLRDAKNKLGLPVSEIIRRAVDDYLSRLGA